MLLPWWNGLRLVCKGKYFDHRPPPLPGDTFDLLKNREKIQLDMKKMNVPDFADYDIFFPVLPSLLVELTIFANKNAKTFGASHHSAEVPPFFQFCDP